MRRTLTTLVLLPALAAGSLTIAATTAPPASPPAASAVARVNGRPVLRRDFDLAVQMAFRQRGPGERGHEDLQAVRSTVLESLIDNELLYQKAVQSKTVVPDADVQKELRQLKDSLGSPTEVAEFLKSNSLAERDLTESVRRTLLVQRFVDAHVASGSKVGQEQARAYYDAHPESFTRPEAVRISQIVMQVLPDARPAARASARERIEAILKELRAGGDFAALARTYSEGPEAAKGGDSGFVWAGGGALPQVERAALQLRPGQMTDILETRRGFHILKATERRPAGVLPFDEASALIVERLNADARTEKVHAYVADLRRTARIEKSL